MSLKQYNPKYELKTRLRTGDQIVVLTGKFKGEVAKINKIDLKKARVYLDGVSFSKRHKKPTENDKGGIVEVPRPLHISNVAVVDPNTSKATRVGFQGSGKEKVRVAKKSGAVLPSPSKDK